MQFISNYIWSRTRWSNNFVIHSDLPVLFKSLKFATLWEIISLLTTQSETINTRFLKVKIYDTCLSCGSEKGAQMWCTEAKVSCLQLLICHLLQSPVFLLNTVKDSAVTHICFWVSLWAALNCVTDVKITEVSLDRELVIICCSV